MRGPACLVVALLALACAAPGPALASARGAGIEQVPAAWTNYAHITRRASEIKAVVVHVTESSFTGTVKWFRNRRAQVSAHYVVGRDGQVVHMVPNSRPAWHAGNHWYNLHSIGVENEGLVGVGGTVTDAEYRASARLVAALLRRYHIPADRRHVVGHNQVPDPYHRGEFGGYSHHTDPGAYWDWSRYMDYVRDYLAGKAPTPRPLDVSIPGLELAQRVTGLVDWTAAPAGETPAEVEFLVDGVPQATLTEAPWVLPWDSLFVPDGRHLLTVRAVGADGRVATATDLVVTANPPPEAPLVTGIGLDQGAVVSGLVQLTPLLAGGPAARVELWVDGSVVETATAPPWQLTWDSSTAVPGPHTLAVRAVGPRDAARAEIVVVTVAAPTELVATAP